eukprot:6068760-Pleurochrysis_carterae.AAC.3
MERLHRRGVEPPFQYASGGDDTVVASTRAQSTEERRCVRTSSIAQPDTMAWKSKWTPAANAAPHAAVRHCVQRRWPCLAGACCLTLQA